MRYEYQLVNMAVDWEGRVDFRKFMMMKFEEMLIYLKRDSNRVVKHLKNLSYLENKFRFS